MNFKDAPLGHKAYKGDACVIRVRHTALGCDWMKLGKSNDWYFHDSLERDGWELEKEPTARDHLELAWDRAHPIHLGNVVPEGTPLLIRGIGTGEITTDVLSRDVVVRNELSFIRTLDPLPDPTPDWLNAPAVLAHVDDNKFQQTAVFTPRGDLPNRWTRAETAWTFHWKELRDVTPLYPKGKEA